jgi:hypothetical protein
MVQYFSGINANDVLELRVMGSTTLAAKFARFRVTSVADSGSYWTFGVAYIDHNGTIDNYDLTAISLFPHNGASGGGSVNQGVGIPNPTGGADGDFYQQGDQTNGWSWWENLSGTWTKMGAAPAVMTHRNSAKIATMGTIPMGRYVESPCSTVGNTFLDAATGVTKPSTNFVCSAANARTTFLGTYGAFGRIQIKVLPTTGLTFTLGVGTNLAGNVVPRIIINDAGTVSFAALGAVIATSPSTALVDDTFSIASLPNAVIFAHQRGETLLGSSLYAGNWANPAYSFYYGAGYHVAGTGEFTGAIFSFWE